MQMRETTIKYFREFPDLGITLLFIREPLYCRKCSVIVDEKMHPHGRSDRVRVSGIKLR
ncbi:MAG TPA: hypothetical protein EYH40_05655 [Desulfurococcales archaeon]|nr:hypothetical protein [Desulfurococcales archaeon]